MLSGPGTKSCLTLTIIVYEMGCQPTLHEIVVNGTARQAPAGQTLLGLLRDLDLEPSRVAVEMNRRIVQRTGWEALELGTGARLEVVQFVGRGERQNKT